MDLIERYLAAVGRHLPPKQAPDIEGELREELLSRQEEREAALGRPLTRQDVEALLLEFGHPLVVAARYREIRYLIGPEVYPFWLTTIRWTVIILAIVYVIVVAVAVMLGRSNLDILRIGSQISNVGWTIAGAITAVFAAFERTGKASFLRDWKPSRLPPPGRGRRGCVTLAVEIVMDVVFILWWLGLIRFKSLFPYPVELSVALAPVWAAWRWPILAYALWEIAANLLAIARPDLTRTNAGMLVGRYLYGVAILAAVFQAGHWVVVGSPILRPEVLATVQTNFDLGMRGGIGLAFLGMLFVAGREFRRASLAQWRAAANAGA